MIVSLCFLDDWNIKKGVIGVVLFKRMEKTASFALLLLVVTFIGSCFMPVTAMAGPVEFKTTVTMLWKGATREQPSATMLFAFEYLQGQFGGPGFMATERKLVRFHDAVEIARVEEGSMWGQTKEIAFTLPYVPSGYSVETTVLEMDNFDSVVSPRTKHGGRLAPKIEVTNTYRAMVGLQAEKVWVGGPVKNRPEVELELRQNGRPVKDSIQKTSGGLVSWRRMDKFDSKGVPYVYTAHEVAVPANYYCLEEGLTVTNHYVSPKIDVTGKVVWVNGPKEKPSVRLQLVQNEAAYGPMVTLENGKTEHTWKDVEERDRDGELYTYTVLEHPVPADYKRTIDGLTVTNTYVRPTKDVTGRVVWVGGPEEKPPVSVWLLLNGEARFRFVYFPSGKTEHTWPNIIFKDENGDLVKRTISTSETFDDYMKEEDGLTVTYTYAPKNTDTRLQGISVGLAQGGKAKFESPLTPMFKSDTRAYTVAKEKNYRLVASMQKQVLGQTATATIDGIKVPLIDKGDRFVIEEYQRLSDGPANLLEVTVKSSDGSTTGTYQVTIADAKEALTGKLIISGDEKLDGTLKATVIDSNNTGELTYTWRRNREAKSDDESPDMRVGQIWEIDSRFDAGNIITCEVTSSVQTGSLVASTGILPTMDDPSRPIVPEKEPGQAVLGVIPVVAIAGEDGVASLVFSDKTIADAIAKAQADAKEQGRSANGTCLELNVAMPVNANSLQASLSQSSLSKLISARVTKLEFTGAPVTLGLDLKALEEIKKQSDGIVNIAMVPAAVISKEAQGYIGKRPVYNITISGVKAGKEIGITKLGNGKATMSIPYRPAKNEAVAYLFGVYVDDKGKVKRIAGSVYDPDSQSVLLSSNHLSQYGVGYTPPLANLKDTKKHWAVSSMDYVLGRGLMEATSATSFSPDAPMTRAMLVSALGKRSGIDPELYTTNSFTDVKTGSVYQPYIEWAYQHGVTSGIGNNQFAPDRPVTREEIAALFSKYAGATGYKFPVLRDLSTYADLASIGKMYRTAVNGMQQSGIMVGGPGNKFNPKSNATRAEVATMIDRYLRMTINPETAMGWALNDLGHYYYYKQGKALTGWQTIDAVQYLFNDKGVLQTGWVQDAAGKWYYFSGNIRRVGWRDIGGKWYYFNTDGSLATSTTIDGYTVNENGVRMTK